MMDRTPGVYFNEKVERCLPNTSSSKAEDVEAFHRRLPEYNETLLVPMPAIARELGIGHLLVKDESLRFGLPSFKVLGASWAVFRAVARRTNLPLSTGLEELGRAARACDLRLIACTDGNWGRACARMASHLQLEIRVFVPKTMDEATQTRIRDEGAVVIVVPSTYDDSVKAAEEESMSTGSLLVQDTAWPGYEEIPRWAVEGYSTTLAEADRQVAASIGKPVDLAIASAGVGSFVQAVTVHYKSQKSHHTRVVAVEPTAAACVRTSLEAGHIVPIETGETIMDGMNCGTVSSIAWPILVHGVDACASVTDIEAHEEVQTMHRNGVNAGPCGAATLAALRWIKRCRPDWLTPASVVILFCTEGRRPYQVPSGGSTL